MGPGFWCHKMDDIQEGYYSGIQKAIRYGDLGLLLTCLEYEKLDEVWLTWRTPAIVAQECWYMMGELAKLDIPDRRFMCKLAAVTTCQDASMIVNSAVSVPDGPTNPLELRKFRFWFDMAKRGDVDAAADDLYDTIVEQVAYRPVSPYEADALRFLRERVKACGILSDRLSYLSAMFLIGSRGIPEKYVTLSVMEDVNSFKEAASDPVKYPVPLPWYVFDRHTKIGMLAATEFMDSFGRDHYKLTAERFFSLWDVFDSLRIPVALSHYKDPWICEAPAFNDSMWLLAYMRWALPFAEMSAKKMLSLWREGIEKDLSRIIRGIYESSK